MDLFQVKTGWRRVRKRENKNYRSVPTRLQIENSKKKFQKHSKNKKNTIVASFQAEISWKMLKRRKIKIIVPFRSYPMRNWKFQKNNKKIQKIKMYHNEIISSQSRLEKDGKNRK